MFLGGIKQRGECEHEDRVVCAAQSGVELDEFLRRRGNQLLLSNNTTWKGFLFLAGSFLNVERDNMHTFMSAEIGLRELGSAISEDTDIGHRYAVWQELNPFQAKHWIILLK